MKDEIPFLVERMDPLGQGVSKITDKVTFVPKTLPGEKGKAQVYKSKGKSVQFAQLLSVETESPRRVSPECNHFNDCSGCRYLHTDYQYECELKKAAYSHFFKDFIDQADIAFHPAPKRHSYRNRVQLHYDKFSGSLGLVNGEKIIQTPDCLLPNEKVKELVDKLYQDQHWLEITKREPESGHIEVSESGYHLNKNYAFGGFTQVFAEMNEMASQAIFKAYDADMKGFVVDLFGGNGNLTKNLNSPTLVLDAIGSNDSMKSHQEFFEFNVYNKWAMKRLDKLLQKPRYIDKECDWLILDPPRSGLKTLSKFVDVFSPKKISYLSCDPLTQVRDLKVISESKWKIESVEFFDFFPGTHHLESLVHLVKRD